MEVYTQETIGKAPSKFLLQIDKQEGQTLLEALEAAVKAAPRKVNLRKMYKTVEAKLCCF